MEVDVVEATRESHYVSTGGLGFERSNVKQWLIDARNRRLVAEGGVPDPTWEPTAALVGRYNELATADPDIALTQKAQGQTNTRYAAGNSERAAVCLVIGEAYSKYRVGAPSASHPMRKNPGTAGAQELEKLVSNYNGGVEVFTIHPALVSNTDDTKVYHCKSSMGRGAAKGNVEFTAYQGDLDVKQNSPKKRDDAPIIANGLGVKSTFTFTAGGFLAPFYATVYGLTDRELPRELTPSGTLIVPVKGFCVGSTVGKRSSL